MKITYKQIDKQTSKQKGFSVVELMVALLLGLFLVSGVTGMYLSSKQTYRVTDNLSRLQESLRFSLEFMTRDIRMASYMPCRFPPTFTNAVTGNTNWHLDYFNFGLRGYEGNVSTFPSEISSDVVAGSDAIAILKGGMFAGTVAFHDDSTNRFTLQDSFPGGEFQKGEVALVCDPRQAALFQVFDSSDSAGTIDYGSNTGIAPGNTTTSIGVFGEDAQITNYEPVIYYIAPSNFNPNVNALKMRDLKAILIGGNETVTMDEEELLDGVESMQILYGLDVDNDQVTDRYEAANDIAVAEWPSVITVRLGLLMSTGEEVAAQIDTNTYNVAGTLISDSSTPAHAGDQKLRYVVNTTVGLRNRVAN